MERSLSIELVRVTEAAALSSARWMVRSLKNEADDAATTAMRTLIYTIQMRSTFVNGEGEKVLYLMLYIGEKLGMGRGPLIDVAVEPREGTSILASGSLNELSLITNTDWGNLLHAP